MSICISLEIFIFTCHNIIVVVMLSSQLYFICSTCLYHVCVVGFGNFDLNKFIEYHHSYFLPHHVLLSDIIPTNN